MGSPLGPALNDIFIYSFKSSWFEGCPNDFKVVLYSRYVDDIFTLFLLLMIQIKLRSICHLKILT